MKWSLYHTSFKHALVYQARSLIFAHRTVIYKVGKDRRVKSDTQTETGIHLAIPMLCMSQRHEGE